jgi:HD-GYP domain-containing protein (c-di-GMP phosphodiesterase class II)
MNLYLRKTNMDIVRALSSAIDASDPYTNGHSLRVTAYSVGIGRQLGLPSDMLEALEYGSLLHDIGKIGVMEAILSKPGRLTMDEYEHIRKHPVIGDTIISSIDFLGKMRPIVRNHHERFDGSGYPDGLKSTSIDIMARIVSVADTYDAITSDRPYRVAMSRERALAILAESRGSQLDPELVDVFVDNKVYLL